MTLLSSTSNTNIAMERSKHHPLCGMQMDLKTALHLEALHLQTEHQSSSDYEVEERSDWHMDSEPGWGFLIDEDETKNETIFNHEQVANVRDFKQSTSGGQVKGREKGLYLLSINTNTTGHTQNRTPTPCSPPVPIPSQKKNSWKHLNFCGEGSDDFNDGFISSGTSHYEKQMQDKHWHLKLSLEARESFEACSHSNDYDSLNDNEYNNRIRDDVFAIDDI